MDDHDAGGDGGPLPEWQQKHAGAADLVGAQDVDQVEAAHHGEAPDWWLREPAAVEERLETLEMEAVEYYLAVYAAGGEFRARTAVDLAEVRPRDECEQEGTVLDPREGGLARNLTIGETHEKQLGQPVFDWLCDGIVTRIGHDELIREDEFCRACVIGERRSSCPA